jgi:beta-glucosidase
MKKSTFLICVVLCIYLAGCQLSPGPTPSAAPSVQAPTPVPVEEGALPPYKDPGLPVETRVEDLLSRMTLAEKIGQMTQVEKYSIEAEDIADLFIGGLLSGGGGYPSNRSNTPENWAKMVNGFQEYALKTRLGIPVIYGVDAVHGHAGVEGAVVFPHNAGLGATRDPDLVERVGQVTAKEMAATGIYWNFAPVVAVPQDIRWGRTHESFSENTELVSTLSAAYIRGLQNVGPDRDLSAPTTVLATPKHYVGDGGTAWGSSDTFVEQQFMLDQGVTDVDEATLRAVHLPPYKEAIDNGALSIMVSFSSWGGLKMHAQKYLLTDVLKGELGFEGFLVSDWAGIDQIPGDYYSDVVTSINAGLDMIMVPIEYHAFITNLTRAVEDGDVPVERIDDAVRRILRVKFELGLFERPFGDDALLPQVGSDEHRAVAREAVSKSLVLLKNEGATLPLSKDTPLIFVAGEGADDVGIQCGGWTIEWQGVYGNISPPGTTILDGVENLVSPNTAVHYNRFGKYDRVVDDSGNPAIAYVGIVAVGELPYAEGVGDRAALSLSDADVALIERVRERSEKLVVILLSGRPLIITDQLPLVDAFVAAWQPGTEGQGVADVLFGDAPFSGKLPYTWPRSMAQLPFDFTNPGTGEAGPLFPFGYGLETEATGTPLALAEGPTEEPQEGEGTEGDAAPAEAPPLQVVFAKYSYTVAEGDSMTIGVKLTAAADEQVTVSYVASDGTATDGDDYTAVAGTLTFEPGVQELTFSLSSLQDAEYEGDETVLLELLDPVNAPLGFNSKLALTIQDDDPYDPAALEDAEREAAARAYEPWGDVTLSLAKIPADSDLALPGQGSIHTVLGVNYGATGADSQGFSRSFARSEDWSDHEGLGFWFYGTQSGNSITVEFQDNRAPGTPSEEWPLIWSDEFEGPAGAPPDPGRWGHDVGGWGWGNAEWQYYTDSTENAALDGNGALVITARQIDAGSGGLECWDGLCAYTSARLLTRAKFEFTYGRVEARIKLPRGQGIWPAFWALGNDFDRVGWPNCGEIDIMENVGFEPSTVHGTVHGPGYSGGSGIGGGIDLPGDEAFADDYYVFAVEWEPEALRWYVDGEQYLTVTPESLPVGGDWVFDHPFFLILNVAVGGYWPGYPDETTEFPQTMHVDYVRVYQAPVIPIESECFEYTFVDDFAGWKEIAIPFTDFVRSADQPEGAPDDGLTLKEVWGYRFIILAGADGEFYLDQVQLK